ncbi:hypothetical protein [Streptomyces ochraceiscleroticus]|uniref:Integral membrane protein n=1 Tax=Streptomyces ochraceiscleroticus TaxID=47761 RepID=A0ABW1MFG0_9ACTN|nr:hypothetical protein [Streptomyces ochraceiscleroticus]
MPPHNDLDDQGIALLMESATPRERRAVLRRRRHRPSSPRDARLTQLVVSLLFLAGGIGALIEHVDAHTSARTVAAYLALIALCAVSAELSRRGRTRISFWLLCTGMIALGLTTPFLL